MDPFSIVVGSVALTEAANKVASALTDTYRAYQDAPTEILSISGEVTFCAGLVDVFAKSVDGYGEKFPRKFQENAGRLVDQCHKILTEIERMIPEGTRGGKESDYKRDLKYAFRKKAIDDKQEKLRQVQHMFMFMSTCWMYQLPSVQNPSPQQDITTSTTPSMPIGSLRGTMEHVPIQINMGTGSQTVTYEATLTLKPTFQPETSYSRERISEKKPGFGESKRMKDNEKESLANMRRSPYFTLSIFGGRERSRSRRYEYSAPIENRRDHEVDFEFVRKKEREERENMRKEGEPVRPETTSLEQASEDVERLIDEWFSDDIEEDSTPLPSPPPPPPPRQPDLGRGNIDAFSPPRKQPSNVIIIEARPPSPSPSSESSSSKRPRPSRAWTCDGCQLKCTNRDKQYHCQECKDFDFCVACYGLKRHWHPYSNFVRL